MCICVYVHIHVEVNKFVCACVWNPEVNLWWLFLSAAHLVLWGRVSQWDLELTNQARLTGQSPPPQRFIALSQCWYYKKTLWCPSFLPGFWELNSGLHISRASTLMMLWLQMAVPPPSWVFVYKFILHFIQLVPKEKFQNYFKPHLHHEKNVWFSKVRAASHSLVELSQWGRASQRRYPG